MGVCRPIIYGSLAPAYVPVYGSFAKPKRREPAAVVTIFYARQFFSGSLPSWNLRSVYNIYTAAARFDHNIRLEKGRKYACENGFIYKKTKEIPYSGFALGFSHTDTLASYPPPCPPT